MYCISGFSCHSHHCFLISPRNILFTFNNMYLSQFCCVVCLCSSSDLFLELCIVHLHPSKIPSPFLPVSFNYVGSIWVMKSEHIQSLHHDLYTMNHSDFSGCVCHQVMQVETWNVSFTKATDMSQIMVESFLACWNVAI